MFAKLLKHEWRATKGIIGLLCVIILVSGLTIGGVMHYLMRVEESGALVVMNEAGASSASAPMSTFMTVLCVLLLMSGIIAVAVCCAGSVFLLIYRFYKSRFTDEGYLTFTLPVTNHQLLLSSILNSVIGIAIVILTALVAVVIAVVLFLMAFPREMIWADVAVTVSEVWESFRAAIEGHGGEMALALSSSLAAAFSELIVLMLAVTIGSLIAKKHKILAAVAVYYGISMVQSFAYMIFAMSAAFSESVTWLLSSPGLLGLITAVCGYFIMHYLTSRKLNLN